MVSGGDPHERGRSPGARQTKDPRRIAVRYKFGLHDEALRVVRQGESLGAYDAPAGHGLRDANLLSAHHQLSEDGVLVRPRESSRMTRSPLSSVSRSQKIR